MAANAWSMQRDADGIVWLTISKPDSSANVLGRDILVELDGLLTDLARSPPRGIVIRSGKPSGFIAGADIKDFTSLTSASLAYALVAGGQRVLDHLEQMPCPTVAAIQGFALGGGLELALACQYRVAVNDDKLTLGFPEVLLGIHPGFGGTVCSVRLIGVRAAMDMMLTGKNIRADKALKLGLVDQLVPATDLENSARQTVLQPPARHKPPLLEAMLSWPLLRALIKPQMLKQVKSKAREDHYPAPYAIIDLWSRYGARGSIAFDAEAHSIAELFMTSTSRNLIRVFNLQDRLKALDGRGKVALQHVHVVGAGVMGGDIAAWCALRGLNVTLQDREEKFVAPAMQRAQDMFAKRLHDPIKVAEASARLRADVAGDGVALADVVIEAIFENLDAKRELYARLEPRMKPAAVLASNTSSIMLEELAAKLTNPARLVGLHFFNPVAQMPLVEIIRTDRTPAEMLQAAIAFSRRIDKLPLPCHSAPGFVVNRVLVPYLYEAMYAVQEGIPLAVVDRAAIDFGMPMGPIELADVVGLDVCEHVGQIVAAAFNKPAPDLKRLQDLLAAKKLGRKSGEGFYVWSNGKAVKPDVAGQTPPADLADRLILALANEAVACLREGVVEDEDLLDAGVIFGAGFAPFRGGPLRYCRERGIDAVLTRLKELETRYGSRFAADAGWAALQAAAKP